LTALCRLMGQVETAGEHIDESVGRSFHVSDGVTGHTGPKAVYVIAADASNGSAPRVTRTPKGGSSFDWSRVSLNHRAGFGGACTQALLFALDRARKDATQNGAGVLLKAMHAELRCRGLRSSVVSLRSSIDAGAIVCPDLLPFDASGCSRALLVGVTYAGHSEHALLGTKNDVADMRWWLVSQLGWPESCVLSLVEGRKRQEPTHRNVLKGLKWLTVEQGGCRVLLFCGHGRDRRILPMDWDTAGGIQDETILKVISKMHGSSRFTCILDCCESASFFSDLRCVSLCGL